MALEELLNSSKNHEFIKTSLESKTPIFDLTEYLHEQEEKFIARQKENENLFAVKG